MEKNEFYKFPYRGYDEFHLTYYKPLIDVQQTSENDSENKLELWNLERHKIKDQRPQWTWPLDSKTDKLSLPIIQPCNLDWILRWTKNGEVIKEDKVKYFSESKRIYFGPFFVVMNVDC